MTDANKKCRCFGNKEGQEDYAKYHDEEWGIPVYDDRLLFEMLILEGAQAGLSWYTILTRRAGYKKAFKNFDPQLVSEMTDEELDSLRTYDGIIKNKLKIYSARTNAKVYLNIQKEFGSFSNFIWAYVDYKPIINKFETMKDMPVSTPLSDKISKDLKKRGMKFVGSTIIYAYMQAVGLVNDHVDECWIRQQSMDIK